MARASRSTARDTPPTSLTLLAENVTDQAHLKINNSGGFSAKELAAIAQTGPGQVIFA